MTLALWQALLGDLLKSLQEALLYLALAHQQLLTLTQAQLQLRALVLAHQLLALAPLQLLVFGSGPMSTFSAQRREGVEHTQYEVGLVIQTNIDRNYRCLSTTSKLFQQASFGYIDTSVQMLE